MQTFLLLDLDGTIIDTPHYEAWCNSAHNFGLKALGYPEYINFIAGRPRLEGARRLLDLNRGHERTAPCNACSISTLAEFKQFEFLRLSSATRLYADAQRLLKRVERSGQCVKFYTASENASHLFYLALSKSEVFFKQHVKVARQRQDQTREELFQELIGEYDVENVTLIDDSPYAVDAACRLGVRACQVRRKTCHPAPKERGISILSSLDDFAVPIRRSTEDRT